MHNNFLAEKEGLENAINEIHTGMLEERLMAMHENVTLALDDLEKAINRIQKSRKKVATDDTKMFVDKVMSMIGKPTEEWEKEGLIYHPEEPM
jgi:hypothetical protein